MSYNKKITEHCDSPKNIGSLDKKSKDVGSAIVGSPSCGDVLKLDIKVQKNIITDAKFKTFGCGSAIAASSLTTEIIKNKTLNDALKVTNLDIAEELELPPIKLHCSVLAKEAITLAIQNYKSKNKATQNKQ